jgi:hypothetical protein
MLRRSSRWARAGGALVALVAPWLIYACGLAPLSTGVSATPTGTGGHGTSSHASSSSTGSGSSSSSSVASSSSAGTGGTGTGGAGSGGTGGVAPDAGDDGDASSPVDAGSDCGTFIVAYPPIASPHIPVCSPINYDSNPPTSGPHYPIWAAYQTYTEPVPRGFYVHDLEHGGIVIAYNCPSGCDPDLAQLASFLDARPADSTCTAPVKFRVVVTPDPLLPTPFAAAAWGWALTSQCFDFAALGPFMDAHYRMAPEDFCSDGIDVTSPDAGIPDGCGQGDGG